MGYYTRYELELYNTKNRMQTLYDDKIIKECFNEWVASALENGEGIKWYEHDADMIEVSKKYPYILFELTGVGEEYPDIWRSYYLNGELQTTKATITFEKCKLIHLHPSQSCGTMKYNQTREEIA